MKVKDNKIYRCFTSKCEKICIYILNKPRLYCIINVVYLVFALSYLFGDIIPFIYRIFGETNVPSLISDLGSYVKLTTKYIPNPTYKTILFIVFTIVEFSLICTKRSVNRTKTNMIIIGHSSQDETQLKLTDTINDYYKPSICELNLIETMRASKENYSEIKRAIVMQDEAINKFMSTINNQDKYGYMGIAHTPLVLRAGHTVGNQTRFHLFHKFRDKGYFEELSNDTNYEAIKIEKKIIRENSSEMIVSISTSFNIEDNQLKIFKPEEKSILKFWTNHLGFDVIKSYKQVDEYVAYIQSEIRDVAKANNILKIHLIISSSVALTFALGQGFSKNYDRDIIIYHHAVRDSRIYPWGISIFNEYDKCLVEN